MRYPTPTVPAPSEDELEAMLRDSVMDVGMVPTTDGCMLMEPDGTCEHGHPTWLVRYGLI